MSGLAVRVLAADVVARLREMEDRGGNLTGVMRDFGEHMKGSIQANFDAQGRPVRWSPLSLAAKISWHTARKSFWDKRGARMSTEGRAAWAGRKVLTDTGTLRRSIYYTATARGLTLATNVKYAAIHQFGGQAGRGRKVFIPARPYLLFQAEDLDYLQRSILRHVTGGP
jgi:phage virion morphogenesis protein